MHRTVLSEPVDAAGALLESARRPRQFEVNDQSAATMQVQPFGGRVGREQNELSLIEQADDLGPLSSGHPSVQQDGRMSGRPQRRFYPRKRVAVFGEHDRWLPDAPHQPQQDANLRFDLRCGKRETLEAPEQQSFAASVRQAWGVQRTIVDVVAERVLFAEWEEELCILGTAPFPREGRCAAGLKTPATPGSRAPVCKVSLP